MIAAAIYDLRPPLSECLETGNWPEGWELLSTHRRQRGGVLRFRPSQGESAVVKLWRCRNRRENVKRLFRLSNARYERRMLLRFKQLGITVPTPLAGFGLRCPTGVEYEVLVVEDLGETIRALNKMKRLCEEHDYSGVTRMGDAVLDMTETMVGARMLDVDHHLNNIVIAQDRGLVRIDVECVRRPVLKAKYAAMYGRMIGRLICSHVYACQHTNIKWSEEFAIRLADRLRPSRRVLSEAERTVRDGLQRQQEWMGKQTELMLAW